MSAQGIYVGKKSVEVGGKTYEPGEVFECEAHELQRLCVQHKGFATYNPAYEYKTKAKTKGEPQDVQRKGNTGEPAETEHNVDDATQS